MAQTLPASRVFPFTVTVPAGTAQASPLTVATTLPTGQVVRIEIDIPEGHVYQTGIFLAVAAGPYIPYGYRQWITGDGLNLGWDFAGLPDSGSWSAVVYNTDIFDHNFYLRYFILDDYLLEQPAPQPPPVTPVLV